MKVKVTLVIKQTVELIVESDSIESAKSTALDNFKPQTLLGDYNRPILDAQVLLNKGRMMPTAGIAINEELFEPDGKTSKRIFAEAEDVNILPDEPEPEFQTKPSNPLVIAELTEDDIERPVLYFTNHMKPERGWIKSWNDNYVFVRYGSSIQGQATSPSALEFEFQKQESC